MRHKIIIIIIIIITYLFIWQNCKILVKHN